MAEAKVEGVQPEDMVKGNKYSISREGMHKGTDLNKVKAIEFDRYEDSVIYGIQIQDGSEFEQKIDEITEITEVE